MSRALKIGKILRCVDDVVHDYKEWSAWIGGANDARGYPARIRHQWNAGNTMAAIVILEYFVARGMRLRKAACIYQQLTWVCIEKRNTSHRNVKCSKE